MDRIGRGIRAAKTRLSVSFLGLRWDIIQDEESGLQGDIMEWKEQLAPENPAYHHHQIGEDNGDAHLKNLLLHHQVVLPITNGRIDFGRSPRLFYCEFDGQRTKRVIVKVLGE